MTSYRSLEPLYILAIVQNHLAPGRERMAARCKHAGLVSRCVSFGATALIQRNRNNPVLGLS